MMIDILLDEEDTEIDRVFALGWKKITSLEVIDTPKTWSEEKPGDRASNNPLYHDLDKLCLWAHWVTQQGLSNGSGRKEYLHSELCARPRSETLLDYGAGHRKDSLQF